MILVRLNRVIRGRKVVILIDPATNTVHCINPDECNDSKCPSNDLSNVITEEN